MWIWAGDAGVLEIYPFPPYCAIMVFKSHPQG